MNTTFAYRLTRTGNNHTWRINLDAYPGIVSSVYSHTGEEKKIYDL